MDKAYCANCGDEFRMMDIGEEIICMGCFSGDGYYYGTEAGLILKMMRADKESWRMEARIRARESGLN